MVAGTYNGHPVAVAAAMSTVKYLIANGEQVYRHVESLGREMERGLQRIFADHGIIASIGRQGSAFSFYFMPNIPVDWHDIRRITISTVTSHCGAR